MPSEISKKYTPKTTPEKLGYLVEECGETLAAVGKTLRWGLESYNPELPVAERETNRDWILREIHDLERAITLVREALTKVRVTYDHKSDVLYVKNTETDIYSSQELPDDTFVIVNRDYHGNPVGLQVLEASKTTTAWHLYEKAIPKYLFVAVSDWISRLGTRAELIGHLVQGEEKS
jgi:uncharacterized protein YuzE